MQNIAQLLEQLPYPFAYDHFAEGEDNQPPYLTYNVKNSHYTDADGLVYFHLNTVEIHLFTLFKSPDVEKQLQTLLDKNNIVYDKTETYLQSLMLYRITFTFDMEEK